MATPRRSDAIPVKGGIHGLAGSPISTTLSWRGGKKKEKKEKKNGRRRNRRFAEHTTLSDRLFVPLSTDSRIPSPPPSTNREYKEGTYELHTHDETNRKKKKTNQSASNHPQPGDSPWTPFQDALNWLISGCGLRNAVLFFSFSFLTR